MGILGSRFSRRKTADRCAPQVDEKIDDHGGHTRYIARKPLTITVEKSGLIFMVNLLCSFATSEL